MKQSEHWISRYKGALMNTFGVPQAVWQRGQGCYLWDVDGRRYLDLLGGIAVNALGYAHPGLVRTLQEQSQRITHVSNFFTTPSQVEAAEAIKSILWGGEGFPSESPVVPRATDPRTSGAGKESVRQKVRAEARVFFCNSGTEANEAAIKLALAHFAQSAPLEPPRLIALKQAFHGRSLGALALTYKQAYRAAFQDFLGKVDFVDPTPQALREAMGKDVAAVFIEPIQGEAGVRPISDRTLQAARQLCDQYRSVLVFDEVQTGIGRCGNWLAYQAAKTDRGEPIIPDLITLAKGLGGGVPVAACVAMNQEMATVFQPGWHGTTFGGGPLATAAVAQTIKILREENLVEKVRQNGELLCEQIRALDSPLIKEVRGRGYLIGIELQEGESAKSGGVGTAGVAGSGEQTGTGGIAETGGATRTDRVAPAGVGLAKQIVAELFERGIIANAATETTIRLAPPLIWKPTDFAEFLTPFQEILHSQA